MKNQTISIDTRKTHKASLNTIKFVSEEVEKSCPNVPAIVHMLMCLYVSKKVYESCLEVVESKHIPNIREIIDEI